MRIILDTSLDHSDGKATQVKEHFVEVPGGQVYVCSWTPAVIESQVPIILLHDSLGSVAQWRSFPLHLSERMKRRVYAYDRLGFGQSSARQCLPSYDFIVEEAEVVFPALCQALNLRQYCLVGHSVGGAMALTIASFHHSECQAVVTLAAPVEIHERLLDGVQAAKQYFAHTESFNKLRKWHGDKTRWVLDAWTETWLADDFRSWSIDPYLPGIVCPVLALQGDADEYGSAELPARIASGIKGAGQHATLADCGHIPHAEQTDAVLKLIESFLT